MVDEHESTSGSTPAPRRRNRRAASRPAGPPETHPDAESAPQEGAAEGVVEQPADVEPEAIVDPEVTEEPEAEPDDASPSAEQASATVEPADGADEVASKLRDGFGKSRAMVQLLMGGGYGTGESVRA